MCGFWEHWAFANLVKTNYWVKVIVFINALMNLIASETTTVVGF
jgi:hypothetical protein